MMKASYVRPDNWINSAWLKIARESRGLSQKELSKRSGISQSRISMMEQSTYFPNEEELSSLCTSMNYPKEFFLREDKPTPIYFRKQ